jgi:hypothetical protein
MMRVEFISSTMSHVPYVTWRGVRMIAIAASLWVLLVPCLAFAKCSDDLRALFDTLRKKMDSMIEADRNQREYTSLSQGLTANQKNDVGEALRALRKMVAITGAGLNQREYASRVLDMVATVDESLRNIPDSQLKTKILLAKDAYVTANSGWSAVPQKSPCACRL